MKKIISLILVAVMIATCCVAFSACGEKKNDGVKAALICLHGDSSTYDKNFIDAFKIACANKGLTEEDYTIVVDIPEDTACYDKAAEFADDGYDVIFADSFGHEPYMLQAAQEFPDVQFCHATGTNAHTANVANFQNAFANIYEGRYLVGVAAGLKLLEMYDTDNDGKITDDEAKIGYVGAHPFAEVISGYTSFYLGVKSIVENVTMEVRYTGSWYDETAEKTTAETLIQNGAKLISQHADSMGAPTACENAGIPNVSYNGTTDKSTFVIASKINWVPYFEYMLDCTINGKDIDANWVGTLANGGVQITAVGPAAAEGTQAKLDEVKAKLMDGSLKVFDCSTFTVTVDPAVKNSYGGVINANCEIDGALVTDTAKSGKLTAYTADVDSDEFYTPETRDGVVVTENGVTYFAESSLRSGPYFDIIIDGITVYQ